LQYKDTYEKRRDPRGRDYYWLSVEDAQVVDGSPDTDAVALAEGYASLTPLSFNLTCQAYIPCLEKWLEGRVDSR
jgi:5'-nucleotidase